MNTIKENLRSYLRTLKGIQAVGLIYDDAKNYHFVVNIYEKCYNETSEKIPPIYEGINVELNKVAESRFLRF